MWYPLGSQLCAYVQKSMQVQETGNVMEREKISAAGTGGLFENACENTPA